MDRPKKVVIIDADDYDRWENERKTHQTHREGLDQGYTHFSFMCDYCGHLYKNHKGEWIKDSRSDSHFVSVCSVCKKEKNNYEMCND